MCLLYLCAFLFWLASAGGAVWCELARERYLKEKDCLPMYPFGTVEIFSALTLGPIMWLASWTFLRKARQQFP